MAEEAALSNANITKTLSLSLVVILILLAACQTTPGVTSEELIGEWRMDGAGYVIQFTGDGSYNVGASEFGQFELEDNLLTLAIADELHSVRAKLAPTRSN